MTEQHDTTAPTPDEAQPTSEDHNEERLASSADVDDLTDPTEAEAEAEGEPADTDAASDTEAGEADPLASAQARIAELEDQLARSQAECYNVSNEYAGYVRRAKSEAPAHRAAGQAEVLEALIPALDDVHAARVHGQLDDDGPFGKIAKKIVDALGNKMGLETYGAEGDPFDPTIHEALMAHDSEDVTEPVIAHVAQPGYKVGERVVRPARVIVHNPA